MNGDRARRWLFGSLAGASAVTMSVAASGATPASAHRASAPALADARMRTLFYAPDQVVTVPVARGIATHIVLAADEVVQLPPATGKGADCRSETDTWCVTATGRDIFVKPKTGADFTDLAIVTTQRRYTFVFEVVPAARTREAVLQLSFELPTPPPMPPMTMEQAAPARVNTQALIAERLRALPQLRNTRYSVAVGTDSDDIVPVMVFDDGTQTYFSFPNNRPVPTVFQTAPDQSEEMVNVRMDDDLLVADRVARRFVLRLGNSVVAIINEQFDLDGQPPINGTTVPGVARVLRASLSGAEEQP